MVDIDYEGQREVEAIKPSRIAISKRKGRKVRDKKKGMSFEWKKGKRKEREKNNEQRR